MFKLVEKSTIWRLAWGATFTFITGTFGAVYFTFATDSLLFSALVTLRLDLAVLFSPRLALVVSLEVWGEVVSLRDDRFSYISTTTISHYYNNPTVIEILH